MATRTQRSAEMDFTEVRNAQDYYGISDGDVLDITPEAGVLVQLEPGTYKVNSNTTMNMDNTGYNFGIESTTLNRADVTLECQNSGDYVTIFDGSGSLDDNTNLPALYFGHISLATKDNFDEHIEISNVGLYGDSIFRDVEVTGYAGHSGCKHVYCNNYDTSGSTVVAAFKDRRPVEYGEYPSNTSNMFFAGSGSQAGALWFESMEIEGANENIIYTGKGDDITHVYNSFFKNAQTGLVRLTSPADITADEDPKSEVVNCSFVCDKNDIQAESVVTRTDRPLQTGRAIWMQTDSSNQRLGATVKDCDIYLGEITKAGALSVHLNTGRAVFRNTRIHNEGEDGDYNRTFFTEDPASGVPTPHKVDYEDVTIYGDNTSNKAAISHDSRDGDIINCCISQPNLTDQAAVELYDNAGYKPTVNIEDTGIESGTDPYNADAGVTLNTTNVDTTINGCDDPIDLTSWGSSDYDSGNTAPAVDTLTISEVETANSDAEFDVDWAVSDTDGNLDTADLTLTDDTDSETEDTQTLTVGGSSESGTERMVAVGDDGSGNSYTVEITVSDTDGLVTTDTATATESDTAAPTSGFSVRLAESGAKRVVDGVYQTVDAAVSASTDSVSNITETAADVSVSVSALGGYYEADLWVQHRETGASTWTESPKTTVSGLGSTTETISGLTSGTDYETRAKAQGLGEANLTATGTISSFTTNSSIITDGLEHRWNFEDTADTTVAVDSVGTNDGTIQGDPVFDTSSPIVGDSTLVLDGTGDHVDGMDRILPKDADFTVMGWADLDSSPSDTYNAFIWDDGTVIYAYWDNDAAPRVWLNGTGEILVGTTNLRGAGETHLGFRRENDTFDLLVNGTVEDTTTVSGAFDTSSAGLHFGARDGDDRLFAGGFDDVRDYSRAVTDSEFTDIVNKNG